MKRTASLAALALSGIGLAVLACAPKPVAPSASDAAAPAGSVRPGVVDARTARALVAAGTKVVDVRTPEEFAAGHVPGAVSIPYEAIGARAAEIGPPSTPVLLYCRTGRRSGIAMETLQAKGFTRVYNLPSYDEWVRSEPAATAR